MKIFILFWCIGRYVIFILRSTSKGLPTHYPISLLGNNSGNDDVTWANESRNHRCLTQICRGINPAGKNLMEQGRGCAELSSNTAATPLQLTVAMWPCISGLAKYFNFSREMKNWSFYINLIIFKCWQLLKNVLKHCMGQRKYICELI